jgi:hypothetical protein
LPVEQRRRGYLQCKSNKKWQLRPSLLGGLK